MKSLDRLNEHLHERYSATMTGCQMQIPIEGCSVQICLYATHIFIVYLVIEIYNEVKYYEERYRGLQFCSLIPDCNFVHLKIYQLAN